MLIPDEKTLMDFLSTPHTETGWKRAFYLDGKLFRVLEDQSGSRQRAAGRAHFARVDPSSVSVVFSEWGQKEYSLSLLTEVVACEDVAILGGASEAPMANRLRRYSKPLRTLGLSYLDVYLRTHVTMGCVDYRIVTDSVGVESQRVSVQWAQPPSVRAVEDAALGGRAVTFTFHNDPESQRPLVVLPGGEERFVIAGPFLAFSQPSQPKFV